MRLGRREWRRRSRHLHDADAAAAVVPATREGHPAVHQREQRVVLALQKVKQATSDVRVLGSFHSKYHSNSHQRVLALQQEQTADCQFWVLKTIAPCQH